MHILFFCREFSNNALGRAYCLWLLARSAGHTTTLATTSPGAFWQPLREEADFLADCRAFLGPNASAELRDEVVRADVVVAVKPLPASLGVASDAIRDVPRPLVVDIDDPDLEVRLPSLSKKGRVSKALAARKENPDLHVLLQRVRQSTVTVSNPTLQQSYGGHLVPHVRNPGAAGDPHTSRQPSVAFIGTPNPHKGLPLLRAAVDEVAASGFTLTVTADPPPDARQHERWIGTTDLSTGIDLLRQADIVALPSLPSRYGPGQLPVKVVDAMLAARAVVVSDLPPLVWAGRGCTRVVPAGSLPELVAALRSLSDPLERQRLGVAARERALELFTVARVQPAFEAALEEARRALRP